jgi:hypothetical protein
MTKTAYRKPPWFLRAAGAGQLRQRGRTEQFAATEVPVDQRPPIIEAYRRRYGCMPTVNRSFDQLPDPAQHPTFRITTHCEDQP